MYIVHMTRKSTALVPLHITGVCVANSNEGICARMHGRPGKIIFFCHLVYTNKSIQTRVSYNLGGLINRGYYTAARRYDFYLRVVKTIFYETSAASE
jgi:hypothetical protein